ncbi:hypothetical protein [Methylobacterium symbioticum]|uniref:Uncharacterized protein n=1 Tax=Methylobacterium symbioticum TaxID=2584084 RepID=A0A509EC43_9HYPH|nr:hypothetical protein [Methylobacterium symbioticum]VUD71827.1 hypothetical protein MET9862_02415 [Methylobacterium symbioticum]
MLARPSRLEALDAAADVLLLPAITAVSLWHAIGYGSALFALNAILTGCVFAWTVNLGFRDESATDLHAFVGLPPLVHLDDEEA